MVEQFSEDSTRKIALLIDGDNAQPSLIEKILTEVGKYGSITIRRIYGDWTTPSMSGWKDTLNNHAIQPVQQFRYTTGKNATDSALSIDAMDILHSHLVDGWANLSTMGFYLHQLDPGFDPRTYGYKQLSQLIKTYSNLFELRFQDEAGRASVYVRMRERET